MSTNAKLRFGLWYDFRNPPAWKRLSIGKWDRSRACDEGRFTTAVRAADYGCQESRQGRTARWQ